MRGSWRKKYASFEALRNKSVIVRAPSLNQRLAIAGPTKRILENLRIVWNHLDRRTCSILRHLPNAKMKNCNF